MMSPCGFGGSSLEVNPHGVGDGGRVQRLIVRSLLSVVSQGRAKPRQE